MDWVQEHIERGGRAWHKAGPLPVVIFCIQQEVRTNNCDTHGDYDQYQEHQQHKAINIVHFVVPKTCEYEVHLDENAAKR